MYFVIVLQALFCTFTITFGATAHNNSYHAGYQSSFCILVQFLFSLTQRISSFAMSSHIPDLFMLGSFHCPKQTFTGIAY